MNDIVLDIGEQLLEEVVALRLVDDQRVLLGVRLQANALAQLVHLREVRDPQLVDHGQHDVPLDSPHDLGAEALFHLIVSRLGVLDQEIDQIIALE